MVKFYKALMIVLRNFVIGCKSPTKCFNENQRVIQESRSNINVTSTFLDHYYNTIYWL